MRILFSALIAIILLTVVGDAIIGLWSQPPFILTKVTLLILSVFGIEQGLGLMIIGSVIWWGISFGVLASLWKLTKMPKIAVAGSAITGVLLWVFGKISPLGAAGIALTYPTLTYAIFEFLIASILLSISCFISVASGQK